MAKRFLSISACLTAVTFFTLPAIGQQSQDAGTTPPAQNQKLSKEQKHKIRKTLKELDTPYK
ncbi:MAG TPA: hypothetical protein VF758_08405, partial [Candidatus Acidoferrum sp.]